MASPYEIALIGIIARIDEEIAKRESRMLTSLTAAELHKIVDELVDLHQSRWERDEALKALRPKSNSPSSH